MTRVLLGILGVLVIALTVQTWRLSNCQGKARALKTCQEVNKLEKDAENATDSELIDRLSN